MANKFVGSKDDFVIPQCHRCKHYKGGEECSAFRGNIPIEIMVNLHDHRKPYPNDNGIRFEPLEAENE